MTALRCCGECGAERDALRKTGGQRHHAYEYECVQCGHTFYWG